MGFGKERGRQVVGEYLVNSPQSCEWIGKRRTLRQRICFKMYGGVACIIAESCVSW